MAQPLSFRKSVGGSLMSRVLTFGDPCEHSIAQARIGTAAAVKEVIDDLRTREWEVISGNPEAASGVPAIRWYEQNFQGMRSVGGSAQARQGTRLVMGAYGHSGDSGTPTFGDDTPDPSIQMRFYDHYLKGLDNGFESDPIVHLYVLVPPNSGNTGSGFWITGNDFPLPDTQIVNYFLHSSGHANTRLGDGVLTG